MSLRSVFAITFPPFSTHSRWNGGEELLRSAFQRCQTRMTFDNGFRRYNQFPLLSLNNNGHIYHVTETMDRKMEKTAEVRTHPYQTASLCVAMKTSKKGRKDNRAKEEMKRVLWVWVRVADWNGKLNESGVQRDESRGEEKKSVEARREIFDYDNGRCENVWTLFPLILYCRGE